MIFATLLSRTQLRQRLVKGSNLEIGLPSEVRCLAFPGFWSLLKGRTNSQIRSHKPERRHGSLPIPQGRVSVMTMSQLGFSSASVTKEEASDFECAPVGQVGVRYEAPYTPHDEI